jgi:hypothetical protein
MSTPKPPLLTPKMLQRLSGKQFTAIRELIEAEEVRRLAPRMPLSRPVDELTAQEARTEMAKIAVAENAWRRQQEEFFRRQGEIWKRRREVEDVVLRAHVATMIGAFVVIKDPGKHVEQRVPKAGDIGRLRKVDRSWALIDFGEELRTWHIPLWAVGDVKDPFADDRPNEDAN